MTLPTGGSGGLRPGVSIDSYAELLALMDAAIAMEAGCELATVDRDFAKFEGPNQKHPLKK